MLEKRYLKQVKDKANKILKTDNDMKIITEFRKMDKRYREAVMDGDCTGMTLEYYLNREAYRMAAHERGYTDDVLERE